MPNVKPISDLRNYKKNHISRRYRKRTGSIPIDLHKFFKMPQGTLPYMKCPLAFLFFT